MAEQFEIEFMKEVVFRDMHGNLQRQFAVGDRVVASHDAGHYFVVGGVGGIYKTEAKRVSND